MQPHDGDYADWPLPLSQHESSFPLFPLSPIDTQHTPRSPHSLPSSLALFQWPTQLDVASPLDPANVVVEAAAVVLSSSSSSSTAQRPSRLRHRHADVLRRRREASAVERLQLLTEQRPQVEEEKKEEVEVVQEGRPGKRKQRDRAGVLHDAADELQRLREQLAEARAREEAQRRRVEQLRAMSSLCRMDSRRALHGVALLRSRMCLVMLSQSGVLLDVSERVVELTGWQRSRLQGSTIGRHDSPPQAEHACPLWVQVTQQPHAAPSLRFLPQYPASKEQLRRLTSGTAHRVEMAFRMWKASGQPFEVACTAWQVDFGDTDGDDELLRRHHVLAWALDDCQLMPMPDIPLPSTLYPPSVCEPPSTLSASSLRAELSRAR